MRLITVDPWLFPWEEKINKLLNIAKKITFSVEIAFEERFTMLIWLKTTGFSFCFSAVFEHLIPLFVHLPPLSYSDLVVTVHMNPQ